MKENIFAALSKLLLTTLRCSKDAFCWLPWWSMISEIHLFYLFAFIFKPHSPVVAAIIKAFHSFCADYWYVCSLYFYIFHFHKQYSVQSFETVNAWLRNLCRGQGFGCLDHWDLFCGWDDMYKRGRFRHLNWKGTKIQNYRFASVTLAK